VRFDPDRGRFRASKFLPGYRSASILVRLVALSFVVTLASSAEGQSTGQEVEIQFDIPAQPLDVALEAYMRAAGLQVLYKSALASGRLSSDVKGRFTRPQALTKLLGGTNLAARYTIEGAFTVFPASNALSDASAAGQIAGYDIYLGNAQSRVIAALCRNAATRPGSYRAAVQFSIGQSGLVDDASLLNTTGDQTRDQNIVGALRRLSIGQAPPPSMPQPVTMLVTPRASGLPDECQRFSR
jgi:hypothetical protein